MPLTYHQRNTGSADPVWIGRVRQAILRYALAISANPAAANRDILLSKAVLASPDRFATPVAVAAAASSAFGDGTANDPLIDSPEGDAALSAVIEGQVWPAFTKDTT